MPYLRTFAALQGHARRSQVSVVCGVFAVHMIRCANFRYAGISFLSSCIICQNVRMVNSQNYQGSTMAIGQHSIHVIL